MLYRGGKVVASILKNRQEAKQQEKSGDNKNSNRNDDSGNNDGKNDNNEDPNGKKPEPSPDPNDKTKEYLKKKVEKKIEERVREGLNEKNKEDNSYNSQPMGSRRSPLDQSDLQKHINKHKTIDGIDYSGHALDRMQERGVTPSVVKNTIENGAKGIGNVEGTFKFSDVINGVEVITSKDGVVITVKLIGKL